jgi:2-oxoglutarate dehydrogenase E2 component (dihydrolipoamide succinyltransferase)
MTVDIQVPSVGESISEATVSRIIEESGTFVKVDEEIVELETDKLNQVVYAPAAGVIQLDVSVDDVVEIGQVIGRVDTSAKKEVVDQVSKAHSPPKSEEKAAPLKGATESAPSARSMPEDFAKAVKKFPAKVSAPINAPTPPPPAHVAVSTQFQSGETSRRRMTGLRKTIAAKLVQAKNQTAMLTTFNEVDMSNIMEIRKREQDAFVKRNGVKLGFMSFFIKATVAALKEIPDLNSFIEGDEIVTIESYDVCIAVSTEKGLMVPVIRGCDEKSFGQIEQDIASFANRSREGKISIDDMRGGSFTITNGGVFGSMLSTPILNPPQSGILGMHTIVKRPVVIQDQIVVRPIMYLALSYDHRIVDGREAIQFLVHMKGNLEEPTRMLIEL